jgi:hypothetical protein
MGAGNPWEVAGFTEGLAGVRRQAVRLIDLGLAIGVGFFGGLSVGSGYNVGTPGEQAKETRGLLMRRRQAMR